MCSKDQDAFSPSAEDYWWILLLTQLCGDGGGDESVGPVDESAGEEREEDVGGVARVVHRGPVHRRDRTPVVHQPEICVMWRYQRYFAEHNI